MGKMVHVVWVRSITLLGCCQSNNEKRFTSVRATKRQNAFDQFSRLYSCESLLKPVQMLLNESLRVYIKLKAAQNDKTEQTRLTLGAFILAPPLV